MKDRATSMKSEVIAPAFDWAWERMILRKLLIKLNLWQRFAARRLFTREGQQ